MSEQFLDRIREGMDALDINGEKIGTVERVHQPLGVGAAVELGKTRPTSEARPFVELESGFLGMGKSLFIPSDHIREISERGLILDVTRHEIEQMGWSELPEGIEP